MDEERKYYVYMYLRTNGTPYYVGKGTGDRAYSKNRKFKPPKDLSRITFHAQNLTEEEAFAIEIELIQKYGRVDNDTGILRNLTDGGEGISGWIPSEEHIAKLSALAKEVLNRPEVRAKLSASTKEAMNRPEVRAKKSAAAKELNNIPEVKKKFVERMTRPEVKEKRREAINRPEVRAKMSASAKEAMTRPEVRAKKSAAIKEAMNRPEVRAKKSASAKEAMNRPEVKEKYRAAAKEAMNRPEVRAKKSAIMKELHAKRRAEKLAAQANLQSFLEEPSTQLDTVAEKQQS